MKVLACIVTVLLAAESVRAVCCSRKGDFGCCGNGPCNIFCCNCDNGCNQQCENTHCDTGEWFECAGIVSVCAAACVVTEGEACAECMGPLYDTCKKCYSSSATCAAKAQNPRDAWFDDIGGASRCISFAAFQTYVETVASAERNGTVPGNRASLILDAHALATEFTKLDADRNGCIDRVEFG